MTDSWEDNLSCAIACSRCDGNLSPQQKRILSVFDHQPICLACKQMEENRPDYAKVSKQMIGSCMTETEVMYSDPGGFCYHHFYPYTCEADESGP